MLITEFTEHGYRTHRQLRDLSFVNPFVINYRGYAFVSQHYYDAFDIPRAHEWTGSVYDLVRIACRTPHEPNVDGLPREIQQITDPIARREAILAYRAETPIYVSDDGLVDNGWLSYDLCTRPAQPGYPEGPVRVTLDVTGVEHVYDGKILHVETRPALPPGNNKAREFMMFAPDMTPVLIVEYNVNIPESPSGRAFGASYMVRSNLGPSHPAWQPALEGCVVRSTFAEAREGVLELIRQSRLREEADQTRSAR